MSNKVNEALITAKSTFDKAKDNFYSKKDKISARSKRNTELFSVPVMTYAPLDSMHYRFTYDFDDTVSFRMDEAEDSTRKNDFVEADFDEHVPESQRVYYAITAVIPKNPLYQKSKGIRMSEGFSARKIGITDFAKI